MPTTNVLTGSLTYRESVNLCLRTSFFFDLDIGLQDHFVRFSFFDLINQIPAHDSCRMNRNPRFFYNSRYIVMGFTLR